MFNGESRHKAKNEVREERKAQGKDLSAVNIRVDTIHSINTYKTYYRGLQGLDFFLPKNAFVFLFHFLTLLSCLLF